MLLDPLGSTTVKREMMPCDMDFYFWVACLLLLLLVPLLVFLVSTVCSRDSERERFHRIGDVLNLYLPVLMVPYIKQKMQVREVF